MAETKTNKAPKQEANAIPAQGVNTASVQEAELNEVDGDPIFHAPDEEGGEDDE
ncbi:hypothetical protein [[Clostridium] symbiosum]|uniref:hypothetical protein n=1 Tax=Clostridium symbiosum TaxID=1512 RepID=UPI003218E169